MTRSKDYKDKYFGDGTGYHWLASGRHTYNVLKAVEDAKIKEAIPKVKTRGVFNSIKDRPCFSCRRKIKAHSKIVVINKKFYFHGSCDPSKNDLKKVK